MKLRSRTNTPQRRPTRFHLSDTLQVKSNLELTMRERGKIIGRRKGHNIWLNLGRQYLAQLITYSSFTGSAGTPLRNDRVQYMGFGIGGTRQLALGTANASPLGASPPSPNGAYPGTNAQTDTDATVTTLERPVRVTGGATVYPYDPADVWLAQVQAPAWALDDVPYDSTFGVLLQQTDVSYNPYLSVPLSEVMLFTGAANKNIYNNTGIAFDTFDTISKTTAFELETQWTIRF